MSISSLIKNLLIPKTIDDDAKEFIEQYKVIPKLIFYYLAIWFKQVFDSPDFQASGFKKDMYLVVAETVSKYLLGIDINEVVTKDKDKLEQIKLAQKYVKKWADDVMGRDKEICEFIVQTLRMHFIYSAYYKGSKEALNIENGRISTLLQDYGGLITKQPTPKYYTNLFHKFLRWYDVVKQKGLIDELEKDY